MTRTKQVAIARMRTRSGFRTSASTHAHDPVLAMIAAAAAASKVANDVSHAHELLAGENSITKEHLRRAVEAANADENKAFIRMLKTRPSTPSGAAALLERIQTDLESHEPIPAVFAGLRSVIVALRNMDAPSKGSAV